MFPGEYFDVMGVPVHRPRGSPRRCVFRQALGAMDFDDTKAITGNAMHLPCVALCMVWLLSFTEHSRRCPGRLGVGGPRGPAAVARASRSQARSRTSDVLE
eukprot:8670945-Lingulodinium_polyedra.AAC.1